MSGLLALVIAHGGLTLVAIALVSMAATAVTIERLWRLAPLRRRHLATHDAFVQQLLRLGPSAVPAPADPQDAMARVIAAAVAARHRGPDAIRVVALDAAQREVPWLERGLGVLLVAAQVAPLLGLLGTVVGLIEAFRAAAGATAVTPAMLADGLYKALGTTVAGLWVAIPSFVAYGGFSSLAGRLSDQLEHAATDLPLLLAPSGPPR
jgi:biopolymer transport protein ExbB